MTAVLERKPVQYDGEVIFDKAITLGGEELLRRAESVFKSRASRWARYTHCEKRDLEHTLVSLQIEPYTHESVEKYKLRMKRSVMLRNLPSRVLADVPEVCGPCGVIALVVWAVIASVCVTFNLVAIAWWFGVIGIVATCSIGIAIGIGTLSDYGWIKVRELHWRSNDITWILNEIPEFVLQTAVDVQTRCPGAYLYVEEAIVANRVVDPFLVAQVNGEKYYLEVWNEPGFTK